MTKRGRLFALLVASVATFAVGAQSNNQQWAATWVASVHGPYPTGNPVAQPELKFAFPTPAAGASDQTFRLIVRPDLWGTRFRIKLSNTFGTQPVTFDGVYLGLQSFAGNIVGGTNRPVSFGGKATVTIAPGASMFSDAVDLPVSLSSVASLDGRKLAVSFHVVGSTGPMTWHAKALQTSYVTKPGSGAHGKDDTDTAFPFTTTSWYFLDAIDVMAPVGTAVVCALGDSITDGTASTLNGDDRWPDVLSRRLHTAYGNRVSVVNAGIGGNRIISPATYPPPQPFPGGPSALQRLDRDVLALSGLSGVVLLEGINDISSGAAADAIIAGMREMVSRIRAKGPIKIAGATITPALGNTGAAGTPEADDRRKAVNAFIRTGGVFDAVADFDAATIDPATGSLKPEFQPNSSVGGPGDFLHPNRAGYQAMGNSIDIKLFSPSR
ncbi:MAG: GDSL-type esterase/lipase family protein [Vicinamibacterales bacterium]|nr:GDSL-type esterase/lipase family protein [Vicinamibacterales bacterium]